MRTLDAILFVSAVQITFGSPQRDQDFFGATCLTIFGEVGECTARPACNATTLTIIEDGSSIIHQRSSNQIPVSCPKQLICCQPAITSSSSTPAVIPAVTGRVGCGWRNEEGVVTKDIISQGTAKQGEFPWMVMLAEVKTVKDSKIRMDYIGDGSLIHEAVVLTTAYNVGKVSIRNAMRVVLGDYDQLANIDSRRNRRVSACEIHPKYNGENYIYDVALLFLRKPAILTSQVGVVCLPPTNSPPPTGTECFTSGWGPDANNVYQYVVNKEQLPVLDRNVCQSKFRRGGLGPYFKLHESFMCAGGELDKDTCKGSSGAPLSCPIQGKPGQYMAAGVMSWGVSCGTDSMPTVYADISRVRDWIDLKMAARNYGIMSYIDY